MAGQKHAGAWHVTEESFRTFLRHKGDDLRPDDVPQLVIQIPVRDEEDRALLREQAPPQTDDHSRQEVDELAWLIKEAKRLKAKAHHLEEIYIESDPSGSTE